jgi:bacterioferritin-associated ferredoxin
LYVCSCNGLTDRDLRWAVGQQGVDRPAAVFAACKCRAQCGTCVRTVCALLGLAGRCSRARDADSQGDFDSFGFALLPSLEIRDAA